MIDTENNESARKDERNVLAKVISTSVALTGPFWDNTPVNACPDDDPIGEPRPMQATPVNNLTPVIDAILAAGFHCTQTITEEMVERAACAIATWANLASESELRALKWGGLKVAQAALTAALGGADD